MIDDFHFVNYELLLRLKGRVLIVIKEKQR